MLRQPHRFRRDPRNPVLPLGPEGSLDATSNMNPFILRRDDEYWLFYAGGCAEGKRRICLATTPIDGDLTQWHKRGPLLEPGPPGSFDARWTVLPHVIEIAPNKWHLYYTANDGVGESLAAFPGIGLAMSDDLIHWTKYERNPILTPPGDDVGIAGGSVLRVGDEWWFYYTACPTLGEDIFLNQQKYCALAISTDGIHWRHRCEVMRRLDDRDYENVACAGPVVRRQSDGTFRMWYSAIGTRWGFYCICYAESDDGLTWHRGDHYGDNLVLQPDADRDTWDSEMVEYPAVIEEDDHLRLFYSGNRYGSTGCGTAVSEG